MALFRFVPDSKSCLQKKEVCMRKFCLTLLAAFSLLFISQPASSDHRPPPSHGNVKVPPPKPHHDVTPQPVHRSGNDLNRHMTPDHKQGHRPPPPPDHKQGHRPPPPPDHKQGHRPPPPPNHKQGHRPPPPPDHKQGHRPPPPPDHRQGHRPPPPPDHKQGHRPPPPPDHRQGHRPPPPPDRPHDGIHHR